MWPCLPLAWNICIRNPRSFTTVHVTNVHKSTVCTDVGLTNFLMYEKFTKRLSHVSAVLNWYSRFLSLLTVCGTIMPFFRLIYLKCRMTEKDLLPAVSLLKCLEYQEGSGLGCSQEPGTLS